jgi:hypothetical protein
MMNFSHALPVESIVMIDVFMLDRISSYVRTLESKGSETRRPVDVINFKLEHSFLLYTVVSGISIGNLMRKAPYFSNMRIKTLRKLL